jgi:broad specificity phosphatase PhoE
LSSLGEQQAQLVAERLQNERFTHIFSSDLSRAYETARAISDNNKVCRCDITLDKRLRERVIKITCYYIYIMIVVVLMNITIHDDDI